MAKSSLTHQVDSDEVAFARYAAEHGWGDGLPLVPPTAERVAVHVLASGQPADTVVAKLPPLNGDCTIELIAVNAVMAGAPAKAMPLLVAAVTAVAEPDFGLAGMNATTAPVVPGLVVNGPARRELEIPYGAGCLGGAAGNSASIGRALRLIMRNVAGQRIGVSSKSVFGQPARVTGVVFAEWEEQSPWPPLAQRHGVPGNAVTAFAANGTMNILVNQFADADALLEQIGRSIAFPGANGFFPRAEYCTILIGINPIWAQVLGRACPDPGTLQQRLWDIAALPASTWRTEDRDRLGEAGRIDPDGRVHVVTDPGKLLVTVCGGRGSLHAAALHGNGACMPFTRAF